MQNSLLSAWAAVFVLITTTWLNEASSQTPIDLADDEAKASTVHVTGQPEKPSLKLTINGAIRFNYFIKSWEGQTGNRHRGGDFAFEMFRIGTDAEYGNLGISAQYRFYLGYNMLHHGYVFYRFTEGLELQVGITQVPFGILPFASHSWFYNLGFCVGLEDDYDTGLKALFKYGGLDIALAFFKNDEWNYSGNSVDSTRYSYDVVRTDEQELAYAGVTEPQTNKEVNQFNLRVAYNINHGNVGNTKIGASGQLGWLYNETQDESGLHWAAAGHLEGDYLGFNLQLEAAYYEFHPANPPGQSRDFVIMGAFDSPYKVAARGLVFGANLAYTIDFDAQYVDSLTFFNDYSAVFKPENGYEHSHGNVVGSILTVGPLVLDLDVGVGLNHPWIGPLYGVGMAEGSADAKWEVRINLCMGLYF